MDGNGNGRVRPKGGVTVVETSDSERNNPLRGCGMSRISNRERSLEGSLCCLSNSDNEEEKGEGEGGDDDKAFLVHVEEVGTELEKIRRRIDRNEIGSHEEQGDSLGSEAGGDAGIVDEEAKSEEERHRERVLDILASQVIVLRNICGCISDHEEDDDDEEGILLELSSGKLFANEDWLFDLSLYYDRAFMLDLVGCLRRHLRANGKRRDDGVDSVRRRRKTTPLSVRIGEQFLFNCGINSHIAHLEGLLIDCISNLPDMLILYVEGDKEGNGISFRTVRPILQSAHLLKELHLSCLDFDTEDELRVFVDCLAPAPPTTAPCGKGKWENLSTLVIEHIYYTNHEAIVLDPIFRVLGVVDEGLLPNLETFKLDANNDLDDDNALVQFINNRTTIKSLALMGFIEPRKRCCLLERHLSTHPTIETLELSAFDFFVGDWEEGRRDGTWMIVPRKEEEEAIFEGMKSLIRLAIANQNLKTISVGGPFHSSLDTRLKPHVRGLFARTEMNRNGLKHFRDGLGSGSSTSWTPRECVEFLIRLRALEGNAIGRWCESYGEEFESHVALEALYLSLRMRPDLCVQ